MLFNSFDFIVFILVVFTVQLGLPHRARNLFLLAASYFFYGCWDYRFLGLMLTSTVIDYVCSGRIFSSQSEASRRRWLTLSIVSNLLVLGFFKYAGFFVDSWLQLAASQGLELSPRTWQIVLPVGISFYTFQTMSYSWDVYRKEMEPLQNFSDFALYVSFFPQLVAGPIERGAKLAPQITEGPRTKWDGVTSGTWLCTKGLFKKMVLADNLAPIVDSVFALPDPSAAQVMIGVYAFAFQIYGDFSGYTDIARGVGRMLGYDLSLNFRLPYLATNPSDFWQRWHISLSTWLRDYLYIPLGGNRGGSLLTYRNLMLTMVLGGLWHGAAWTFVIWGVYHGTILILHRLASGVLPNFSSAGSHVIKVVVMFHLTCLGWLIFRAESVSQIQLMLASLLQWSPLTIQDWQHVWMLAFLAMPLMALHVGKQWTSNLNFVPSLSWPSRLAVYSIVTAMILTLGSIGQREFIYFQF